jgi:hypothetical protein
MAENIIGIEPVRLVRLLVMKIRMDFAFPSILSKNPAASTPRGDDAAGFFVLSGFLGKQGVTV